LTPGKPAISLAIVLFYLGRVVTITALCCAIGLHWMALQSLAWTSMFIEYSKRAPLCQAITQTFDGAHPCSLCHIVNKGKNSEKKSELQLPASKIDMIYTARSGRLIRPSIYFEYVMRDFHSSKIRRAPPVPPPRSLLS
jgi:hypothetical protein